MLDVSVDGLIETTFYLIVGSLCMFTIAGFISLVFKNKKGSAIINIAWTH